jgi:hypothetical protein
LQEQTWSELSTEVLGQESFSEAFNQITNGDDVTSGALSFAQEQVEQWTIENIPLPTRSPTPVPETPEVSEEVCYGMV